LKEIHIINPDAVHDCRRHAITIAPVLGLATPMLPVQAQSVQSWYWKRNVAH
jgi:hypothetical protein